MQTESSKTIEKIDKVVKRGNVRQAIELCQLSLQEDPTNADLHLTMKSGFIDFFPTSNFTLLSYKLSM